MEQKNKLNNPIHHQKQMSQNKIMEQEPPSEENDTTTFSLLLQNERQEVLSIHLPCLINFVVYFVVPMGIFPMENLGCFLQGKPAVTVTLPSLN